MQIIKENETKESEKPRCVVTERECHNRQRLTNLIPLGYWLTWILALGARGGWWRGVSRVFGITMLAGGDGEAGLAQMSVISGLPHPGQTGGGKSVIILLVPGSEVVGMGCKLQLLRPLLRKCHHWREHYNERCTCLGDRAVLRIDNKVRHSSPPGSIQISNVASQTPEPSDWKGLHHA